MKIKAWVEFSEEVDVEIGKDEICAALTVTPAPGETWFAVLNRFALCLNALPAAILATWTPAQRQTVHTFLAAQAARFADTPERLEPAKQKQHDEHHEDHADDA